MKHEVPVLGFEFDALEPYMDARTVELHWGKHHHTYVAKLNAALEKHPEFFDKTVEWLLGNLDLVPEDIRTAVRNHGGGHANHSLFWKTLGKGNECSGEILKKIEDSFGSFDDFKKEFTEKAVAFFGSGWVWLVKGEDGKLEIMATANQDSPLSVGKKPILVIDLWEHAYYLKYQNRRPEFVEAWWSLVDWNKVERLLSS